METWKKEENLEMDLRIILLDSDEIRHGRKREFRNGSEDNIIGL